MGDPPSVHGRGGSRARRRAPAVAAILALGLAGVVVAPPPEAVGGTDAPPQLEVVASDYRIRPLISSGEEVPLTGDTSKRFMLVGIPDGLGAYPNPDGTFTVMVNHEFAANIVSQPHVGAPDTRGAFVSKLIIDGLGNVVSGSRAYSQSFVENTPAGPAAAVDNTTGAFGRLCSGFLGDSRVGFDRPIYLAGEETQSPATAGTTFDPLGSSGVAFFDGEAHVLPKMGHFPKENLVVMPGTGDRTVILIPEDGPRTPDSQLYMWVRTKDPAPGASVLAKNGLLDGKLYVFVGPSLAMNNELAFTTGTITGTWVEVVGAATMSDTDLETVVDTLGAFGFVRIEDVASSVNQTGEGFFVTTGDSMDTSNKLGRLYTFKLDATDPILPAQVNLVVNADTVVAGGGDTIVSPDNIAVSADYVMVQEDGTESSRPTMSAKKRDGSIWRFPLTGTTWETRVDVAGARRVAQLDPPGRDGTAVGAGVWESTGIIDAEPVTGVPNSWLTAVQAHPPTAAPRPKSVEDGQLLLLTPAVDDHGYWLVGGDGGIFNYGSAKFYGSTGGMKLNQPVIGMAPTPSGKGYWLVAGDGGIFSYGDARFHGSTGDIKLNKPIVGMAATPTGLGYWLVASDGGIFSYGDARFYGSTGDIKLNKPIVAMAPTPSGQGYWLFASDGGVFTYGTAVFRGSAGAIKLNKPIVTAGASPSGQGYWMVASDGGIFNYGQAAFYGSTGNIKLNDPIVGMTPTPTGLGYWVAASDGGLFSYGDATFKGSVVASGVKVTKGIVGFAGYRGGIKPAA